MAAEYTPTVNATAQLAAAVSTTHAPPNKADIVLSPLCMSIDARGMRSLVVKIPNPSDMTAASPATYGTALSNNDSLAFDAASSVTIAEGAAARGIILDTAVALERPDLDSVDALMQNGSIEQKAAVCGPEIMRLVGACLETFEADHCALTTSPSNSVGTSATPLGISDLFSAIYTYDTLESITRETALLLWAVQIRDITNDMLVNGGGLGGAVWGNIDTSFLNASQLPTNGAKASLLGRAVYQGSHSLRTLSDGNANVNGMLFAVGRGDPYKPGAQYGYICNAIRPAASGLPFVVRMINDPDQRGTKVSVVMEYGAAEFRDTMAVRIKSKAT